MAFGSEQIRDYSNTIAFTSPYEQGTAVRVWHDGKGLVIEADVNPRRTVRIDDVQLCVDLENGETKLELDDSL